jgi:RNA polymerase sigma-70 factor (ECF subfamily)
LSDGERFEAFVRAYQDMVFATAVRLLGNREEAEDVAQMVFLKAFEQFETLDGNPAAGGWLRTVARNTCLNHLSRYRSRWRFFSELRRPAFAQSAAAETGGADDAGFEATLMAASDSPAHELERARDRERLEQALQQLPAHQRVPLVLYHFEDASYDEIARTLRISLSKVKTDIHRGREALRKHLGAKNPAEAGRHGTEGPAKAGLRNSHGPR